MGKGGGIQEREIPNKGQGVDKTGLEGREICWALKGNVILAHVSKRELNI